MDNAKSCSAFFSSCNVNIPTNNSAALVANEAVGVRSLDSLFFRFVVDVVVVVFKVMLEAFRGIPEDIFMHK